jgi:hypothetical protein
MFNINNNELMSTIPCRTPFQPSVAPKALLFHLKQKINGGKLILIPKSHQI